MWEQRAGRRRDDDKLEDGAAGRAEVMEDLPQAPALPHLSCFFLRRHGAATGLRGCLWNRTQQASYEDVRPAMRAPYLAEAFRHPRTGAAEAHAAHSPTPNTGRSTGSRRILLENCVGRLTGRRRRA